MKRQDQREERTWWDLEAGEDGRYKTRIWGGDGTQAQIGPTMSAILDNIEMVMARVAATHVLEIGCGPGRLLRPLAFAHPTISFAGIDISPSMVALGNPWPNNVTTETFDGRYFSKLDLFAATKFDVIYSVEVFQHLNHETVELFLRQAKKVLKPNGRIIFQFVEGIDEDTFVCHPASFVQVAGWLREANLTVEYGWEPHQIHDEWTWVVAQ